MALACAGLLVAAGCGSDDESKGRPIPQQAANDLARRLDEVQRRFDAATERGQTGACDDIDRDSYPAIDGIIESLPGDVDEDVRDALGASVERLRELTSDGCSKAQETRTEEEPTPTVTTPPPPRVETETQPPETETQTETQPRRTEPQQTTPDRQDDPRDGGIGPNGQGPPGQNGGGQEAPGQGNG